jgi:hypothetical protein
MVYILPLLIAVAMGAYSVWARKRVGAMTPEQARAHVHAFHATWFDLHEGESVVGFWSGIAHLGRVTTAERVGAAVLNSVSRDVTGVSTYVPYVHVGLTSLGRVLVSREYTDMFERGHFKQARAFPPGTRAVDVVAEQPGLDVGAAPFDASHLPGSLRLVQLRAPTTEPYEVWLSPQGSQDGYAERRSICEAIGGGDPQTRSNEHEAHA